ncbi:MAG: portal protein [Cyclobacteriaceae bacterium]
MSKKEDLRIIHERAIRNFDNIQTALRAERKQCLEDRRFSFISGAQWEGSLKEQFEGKPKFEVNKISLSVRKIENEYRNNRITVDYISKDGTENDKLADVCDGLFRADERDSGAEEAYDNAFSEAIRGGFGALRLTTCYEDDEDDENDKLRIKIEPIYDADSSVWFDLDSKRQDKSDSKYCFVITSMTPETFEEEYDKNISSINKDIQANEYDWYTPDVVYVAEYYRIEEVKESVRVFEGLTGDKIKYTAEDFKSDTALEQSLKVTGYKEISNKRVTKRKVHKYIMSGSEIIEDCGFIAGKYIPVIPVYGERCFIDNIERCVGHVRLAKDMQRLKNMQISKLAEISALSSVEKPIFTPEQIIGHENRWAEDNIKNYPFMVVNPITDASGNLIPTGPIGYTKPASIPQSLAALLQLTDADMKEILGNQGDADKMVSNMSGKAVELIQSRIDGQAFIFMSNMAKSIRMVGQVWLYMAKEVYVEENRSMKTIGKMNDINTVELMTLGLSDDGEIIKKNDLTKASFDVAVDVGPSSSSKKQATVRSLINMLSVTSDPETSQVLQAMAMMNMEGEGISGTNEYFRKKLVRLGALEPNEEEQEQMAAAADQVSAQDEALKAMAKESEAKATKAHVDTINAMAEAEKTKAETIEIQVDTEAQQIENIIKTQTTSMP